MRLGGGSCRLVGPRTLSYCPAMLARTLSFAVLPVLLLAACQAAEPPPAEGPRCELGAPQVAGTAETDALANNPARCGMPAYKWLRSERLGEIVERGDVVQYEPETLELAAAVGGVELPSPPLFDVQVEQLLYLTQDRGELIEATALVGYPTSAGPDRALDIVMILHGTSGFTDGCGPSGENDARSLVALFASLGMVAVAPDFIGLKGMGEPTGFLHPYLNGEATALASLDAVRAGARAVAENQPDRCLHPRLALFGGSQGGHAALWVDRLQPYYAREIELVGGVAAVPPADLLGQAERALQETVQASGNTAVMMAAAATWYGYEDRLDEVFNAPYAVDLPAAMAATCDPSDLVGDLTIEQLYTPALLETAANGAFADSDPWGCIVHANSFLPEPVKRITPQSASYGLLMVFGELDALVHTPIEREAFDALCEQGMRLDFLECAGAAHTKALAWSYPEILSYLQARLAGEPLDEANVCKRSAPTTCSATPAP